MNGMNLGIWQTYSTAFLIVMATFISATQYGVNSTNSSYTTTSDTTMPMVPLASPFKPPKMDLHLRGSDTLLSAQVRKSRRKRNVMQMARMLKCVSGCNPLSYRGYGCYCGYMGSGQPVDEIDRCCLQHDWCYAFISCPQTLIYFVPYTWYCTNPGTASCGVPSMPGVSQKCATQLCECDREFARCISNYPCPRKKPGCKGSNYVVFQSIVSNDI